MNSKLLTLGTIRDYILEYCPDLLWWDGYNKHEPFNPSRSYKHRAGMPNEIRIEFDYDDKDKNWEAVNFTAINLYNLDYSFAIFSVEGGRGPHIHIYDLDELESLDYERRTIYRKMFVRMVVPKEYTPDFELCDEKHLCALEFVNHFKYNKPKELLCYFWRGRNSSIDFDLKNKALEHEINTKKVKSSKEQLKLGDLIRYSKRETIINSLDFEKVLDKYGVKYKGYMANCPFHNDTNNSLSFSNDKGLWKCFGCSAKGDIITLIKMLKERENGDKK